MKRFIKIFPKAVLLGSIVVIILMLLKFLALFVLKNLYEFWPSSLFVTFGTTGTPATLIEHAEAVLYTIVSVGVIGLLLLIKGKGDKSFGDGAFEKIPIVRTIWGFIHTISELAHHITERSFILALDWPNDGYDAIGVITKKQTFTRNGKRVFSKPTIYIFTPPNPISGFMNFPKRDKLILLISPANQLLQLIISLGMLGPKYIELAPDPDQSRLDWYYE